MVIPQTDTFVFLAGRPPIQEFVRFVKTRAINGQEVDEVALTGMWRDANARVRELQASEGGCGDYSELQPLESSVAALAAAELDDPVLQRSLGFLPCRWAQVELDRLVVWQRCINWSHVERLRSAFNPSLSGGDLVRLAVGKLLDPPSFEVVQLDANTFSFTSASSDLRILDARAINPMSVQGYQPYGYAKGGLGVFAGHGPNLLTAFHMRGRLVLTNGSHRACALRALGVTHAPCLVQYSSNETELELVGVSELLKNFEAYFVAARPPLFKDYFDERLRKLISVRRSKAVLQAQITIRESRVPID